MTQNKQILEHTLHKWITDIEALTQFGCRRLAARINELDGMGYTFDRKWLELPSNRRIKQYRLSKDGRKLYRKHLQMIKERGGK